jgi:hypothetical protein
LPPDRYERASFGRRSCASIVARNRSSPRSISASERSLRTGTILATHTTPASSTCPPRGDNAESSASRPHVPRASRMEYPSPSPGARLWIPQTGQP